MTDLMQLSPEIRDLVRNDEPPRVIQIACRQAPSTRNENRRTVRNDLLKDSRVVGVVDVNPATTASNVEGVEKIPHQLEMLRVVSTEDGADIRKDAHVAVLVRMGIVSGEPPKPGRICSGK